MKYYQIRFTYDHYCQGYEDAVETILVEAETKGEAIRLIKIVYKNARDFEDLTLRQPN